MIQKSIFIGVLCASIAVVSGCVGTSSSSPAIGGVMKSDDAGRTFSPHNTIDAKRTIARYNVSAMAIDPHNSTTVYGGTTTADLFVSRDGAQTWTLLPCGLTAIHAILVDARNPQTLYVSGMYEGRGSVVRSDDGGQQWRRIYVEPTDGTNISAMVMDPHNTQVVYIGTTGGTIARTDNGGTTWKNIYDAKNRVSALAINPQNVAAVYALVGTTDVVVSYDDGATFESVNSMKRDSATQKKYTGTLHSMTVDPAVPNSIIVGTNSGIFRSYDNGLSWDAVDVIASTVGVPIYALAISPHDGQLVYAAAKAVYTSVGSEWAITDTTSAYTVGTILHDPFNPNVIYLGMQKVK